MLLHHSSRGSRSFAVLAAACFALAACSGDDPSPTGPSNPTPTLGDLNVTVTTTGEDVDADGYSVSVAGTNRGTVAANGSLLIEDLAAGTYAVELGGLTQNCGIGATTSKSATVTAGQTATATFDLTCVKNAGVLRIETTTDGLLLDPDGYEVSAVGGAPVAVGVNGEAFLDVAPGVQQTVALSGQAANCTPHGETSTTATVAFGDTATVGFDVTCFRDPIVYEVRLANDHTHLFVVDASGGTAVDLTSAPGYDFSNLGPGGRGSGLNPDRTHVVFASQSESQGLAEYDIFVVALNKSETLSYAPSGPQLAPAWSPDGTKISFTDFTTGEVTIASSDLSSIETLGAGGGARFSPDGSRLAFWVGDDIWVMNADGTGRMNVTSPNGPRPANTADQFLSWAPDGSSILVERVDFTTNDIDLYLADASGTDDPLQLTNDPENERGAFGPDGRIYFEQCSSLCGSIDVWVMNADGTGATQLTNSGDEYFLDAFNPGVTFEGAVTPGVQILTAIGAPFDTGRTMYRMGTDGTGRTEIVDGMFEGVSWD